jgi:hypothetical protein
MDGDVSSCESGDAGHPRCHSVSIRATDAESTSTSLIGVVG